MMQAAPGRHDRFDRPRFRQDLIAESIDDQGARFIDVMDPDSGSLFRFYEVEYSLACAMDGERDVPGIVKWAQEELGLTPSQQEIRTVIATLGDLGFIDAGEAAAQVPTAELAAPAATLQAPSDLGLELAPAGRGTPARAPSPPAPEATPGALRATAKHPVQVPDDVALGAPGRGPARPTPNPPATGASDVSIDLSDHIAVRPDDVKEAVRASRVMAAVDVPRDLLDTIEDRSSAKPPPPPSAKAKPPEVTRPPEIARPPEVMKPPEATQEAKSEARTGRTPVTWQQPDASSVARPPVELPKPPAPVTKPVQPPAPGARVSPLLIVLLILAVVGGGAFVVWKYVLEKPDPTASSSTEPAPPVVQPAPPAPPPPPAPASQIVLEAPAPDDLTTSRPGVIETILADSAPVKAGDVIVKLVGDKPIEAEIASITRDAKRAQDQIDAVTKRRDAAQVAGNKAAETAAETELADRQKTLAAKQDLLATRTADLDKFLIHAPSNGTFTPVSKLGQKIAADAVVGKLQREASATATFKIADGTPFAANASIEVAIGKGEQHVTCTVAAVQPGSVKVACPTAPALTEGTDVTLRAAASPEPPPAR